MVQAASGALLAHLDACSKRGVGHQSGARGRLNPGCLGLWLPRAQRLNGLISQMNLTISPLTQGWEGAAPFPVHPESLPTMGNPGLPTSSCAPAPEPAVWFWGFTRASGLKPRPPGSCYRRSA